MATHNGMIGSNASRNQLLSSPTLREKIAVRAYELHELRGREPGRDVDDWLQAENEVLAMFGEVSSPRPKKAVVNRRRKGATGSARKRKVQS